MGSDRRGQLLTSIHLMQTGSTEANLIALNLNQEFRLPYIADLVDRKIHGAEKSKLEIPEIEFHRREYESLVGRLETAATESRLPDEASCRKALNDLLVRVRLRDRRV